MKQVMTWLTAEQHAWLESRKAEFGCSMAFTIRKAIDAAMAADGVVPVQEASGDA